MQNALINAKALAISDLLGYACWHYDNYYIGRHHAIIAKALMDVEAGRTKRLMIMMPPRHGKTMLASELFPAFFLSRNSKKSIIAATYAQELANDYGRKVRNLIASAQNSILFETRLADDSAAQNRFHTRAGGGYFGIGAGGAATGRGADLLIIDDPIKGRAEADSAAEKRRLWDWYSAVAYTRLMPNGAIVIIQTRWAEDDLCGRILAEHGHEGWQVLRLPAINDAGQALWPEAYPIETLTRIKQTMMLRDWQALYQQNPTPAEGLQFKEGWFGRYRLGEHPAGCHYYLVSDFAVTADAGDYTEHSIWAVDQQGHLWAVDWWYGQTSADVWIDKALALIKQWQPLAWIGEAGVIRRALEPMITMRMREKKTYCRLHWLPPINDKATRARAFEARASMEMVHLPRSEWGDRVIDQLLRFPAGKYDDAVDVCSLMALALDKALLGDAPKQPTAMVHEDNWTFDAVVRMNEAKQRLAALEQGY